MTSNGSTDAGARAEAMARRLDRTARRLGMTSETRDLLRQAFRAAMEPRVARLRDHHPDYLHPARTALILMDDCRVSDGDTLVAALLAETRASSLTVTARMVESLTPAAARILAAIPDPVREGDRLLESLLALDVDAGMVAAAERLDHARHLHLRPRDEWAEYHATTCAAYAPVAPRAHPRLGERLDWWCSTFRDRFLQS